MKKSKLILGTVQLGKAYGINNQSGKPSKEKAFEILARSSQEGICDYDTADNYGDSAQLLGDFFKINSSINILAKGSLQGRTITESIKASLSQIGVTSVFSYSLHAASEIDLVNFDEVASMKKAGFIKQFGVSVYTNDEIDKASKIKEIDCIQIPFNMLDNWNLRGKSILNAKAQGKMIHCRSVFLQGLFFKNLSLLPDKLFPLKNHLNSIHDISKESNVSIQDLALGYLMSIPEIDRVLIGVENLEQLEDNLKSVNVEINSSILKKIQDIHVENISLLNPANW